MAGPAGVDPAVAGSGVANPVVHTSIIKRSGLIGSLFILMRIALRLCKPDEVAAEIVTTCASTELLMAHNRASAPHLEPLFFILNPAVDGVQYTISGAAAPGAGNHFKKALMTKIFTLTSSKIATRQERVHVNDCYPIMFNLTRSFWHELCIRVKRGTVLPYKRASPGAVIPHRAFLF